MEKPFKAYIVSSDESSVIRYARHAVTARLDGAHELLEDFSYVTCRRAAQYDDLFPHGPTDEQKFDDGWWFECSLCRHGRADCEEGMRSDGRFFCAGCVAGFTEMRSIRTPSHLNRFFGGDYMVDDAGKWGEVLPPVSKLPIPNHSGYECPYTWYSPFN